MIRMINTNKQDGLTNGLDRGRKTPDEPEHSEPAVLEDRYPHDIDE